PGQRQPAHPGHLRPVRLLSRGAGADRGERRPGRPRGRFMITTPTNPAAASAREKALALVGDLVEDLAALEDLLSSGRPLPGAALGQLALDLAEARRKLGTRLARLRGAEAGTGRITSVSWPRPPAVAGGAGRAGAEQAEQHRGR